MTPPIHVGLLIGLLMCGLVWVTTHGWLMGVARLLYAEDSVSLVSSLIPVDNLPFQECSLSLKPRLF